MAKYRRCDPMARQSASDLARSIRRSCQAKKCMDAQALLDEMHFYDRQLCLQPSARARLSQQVKRCFTGKLAARRGRR